MTARAPRLALLALLGGAAGAGGCASARPEAALAVTRDDGRVVPLDSATAAFSVGGVRVIHRPNFATDVVAVHLYLLGGVRQLEPATQGAEALLLRAGEYGTAGYPGARWRAAWGATGSQLEIDPALDWTLVAFRGVRDEFDASWDAFADRVMRPTLAPAAVAAARARLVARLRAERTSPDGLTFALADSVAHRGHPYALRPGGTEASLAALDSAALARYHAGAVVGSRMLLVVVGGVGRPAVEAAVRRTLARLPAGDYRWTLPTPSAPPAGRSDDAAAVTFVARQSATNYVLGLFDGPPASAPDAAAFRVAAAFLSARVHQEVRVERGLSYAAYAPYFDRGVTGAGVYMSTTAPAAALPVVRAQLQALRDESVPAASMRFFTQQFVTGYIADNMTSAAQADFLARAQLYQGDYRSALTAMEALRGVSGGEVRAAARRYFRQPRFVYVGDTTRVARAAFAGM